MTQQLTRFVVAIVDDDQSVIESLGLLFESADYEVRLFTCGTALLKGGRLAEIDCLVSDIDMPVMDGFALLREAHRVRPDLPAILITGYPDKLKRLPPLERGTTLVFSKPLQGPELLAAVSAALGEKRA
jgi:FixJ family two-component response regulator